MAERDKQSRPAPTPTNITQPFWDGINQHRFLLQYDPEADKYQFYPRAISVHTGKQNLEWREVSGKGILYSYTQTHIAARGFEGEEPNVEGEGLELKEAQLEGSELFARFSPLSFSTY